MSEFTLELRASEISKSQKKLMGEKTSFVLQPLIEPSAIAKGAKCKFFPDSSPCFIIPHRQSIDVLTLTPSGPKPRITIPFHKNIHSLHVIPSRILSKTIGPDSILVFFTDSSFIIFSDPNQIKFIYSPPISDLSEMPTLDSEQAFTSFHPYLPLFMFYTIPGVIKMWSTDSSGFLYDIRLPDLNIVDLCFLTTQNPIIAVLSEAPQYKSLSVFSYDRKLLVTTQIESLSVQELSDPTACLIVPIEYSSKNKRPFLLILGQRYISSIGRTGVIDAEVSFSSPPTAFCEISSGIFLIALKDGSFYSYIIDTNDLLSIGTLPTTPSSIIQVDGPYLYIGSRFNSPLFIKLKSNFQKSLPNKENSQNDNINGNDNSQNNKDNDNSQNNKDNDNSQNNKDNDNSQNDRDNDNSQSDKDNSPNSVEKQLENIEILQNSLNAANQFEILNIMKKTPLFNDFSPYVREAGGFYASENDSISLLQTGASFTPEIEVSVPSISNIFSFDSYLIVSTITSSYLLQYNFETTELTLITDIPNFQSKCSTNFVISLSDNSFIQVTENDLHLCTINHNNILNSKSNLSQHYDDDIIEVVGTENRIYILFDNYVIEETIDLEEIGRIEIEQGRTISASEDLFIISTWTNEVKLYSSDTFELIYAIIIPSIASLHFLSSAFELHLFGITDDGSILDLQNLLHSPSSQLFTSQTSQSSQISQSSQKLQTSQSSQKLQTSQSSQKSNGSSNLNGTSKLKANSKGNLNLSQNRSEKKSPEIYEIASCPGHPPVFSLSNAILAGHTIIFADGNAQSIQIPTYLNGTTLSHSRIALACHGRLIIGYIEESGHCVITSTSVNPTQLNLSIHPSSTGRLLITSRGTIIPSPDKATHVQFTISCLVIPKFALVFTFKLNPDEEVTSIIPLKTSSASLIGTSSAQGGRIIALKEILDGKLRIVCEKEIDGGVLCSTEINDSIFVAGRGRIHIFKFICSEAGHYQFKHLQSIETIGPARSLLIASHLLVLFSACSGITVFSNNLSQTNQSQTGPHQTHHSQNINNINNNFGNDNSHNESLLNDNSSQLNNSQNNNNNYNNFGNVNELGLINGSEGGMLVRCAEMPCDNILIGCGMKAKYNFRWDLFAAVDGGIIKVMCLTENSNGIDLQETGSIWVGGLVRAMTVVRDGYLIISTEEGGAYTLMKISQKKKKILAAIESGILEMLPTEDNENNKVISGQILEMYSKIGKKKRNNLAEVVKATPKQIDDLIAELKRQIGKLCSSLAPSH